MEIDVKDLPDDIGELDENATIVLSDIDEMQDEAFWED